MGGGGGRRGGGTPILTDLKHCNFSGTKRLLLPKNKVIRICTAGLPWVFGNKGTWSISAGEQVPWVPEGFFLFCFAATVSGEAARSRLRRSLSPPNNAKTKKPSGTQGTEQGNIKQFWELREQNSVKMKTSKIEI